MGPRSYWVGILALAIATCYFKFSVHELGLYVLLGLAAIWWHLHFKLSWE